MTCVRNYNSRHFLKNHVRWVLLQNSSKYRNIENIDKDFKCIPNYLEPKDIFSRDMNTCFIYWIYCMNLLPDQKQKAYDTKDFSNKNCRDLKYQYNSPKPFLHSSISPQSPSCFCCKFLLCCWIAYLPIYVRTKHKRSFKPNHLIIKGNTEVALPRRKRTN